MLKENTRQYPARFSGGEWKEIESRATGGYRSLNDQIRLLVNQGLRFEKARDAMKEAVENCELDRHLPLTSTIRCARCQTFMEVLNDAAT